MRDAPGGSNGGIDVSAKAIEVGEHGGDGPDHEVRRVFVAGAIHRPLMP